MQCLWTCQNLYRSSSIYRLLFSCYKLIMMVLYVKNERSDIMSINPNYMTSGIIEYGARELPYEKDLKEAYISDIKERFSSLATEFEKEEFTRTLNEMYALRDYVSNLGELLRTLTKEDKETNTERFIRHALKNLDAKDIMTQLDAVIDATDIGIAEFEKLLPQESEKEEVHIQKR